MKKILSLAVALVAVAQIFTGCSNEEKDLFSSSAAERLAESKNIYTNLLGNTTWVMEYYPLPYLELDPGSGLPYPQGLGYVIMNRFKSDNSVEQAMQNNACKNQYRNAVSLWEVITDRGPVLTFNTFNPCIHNFSDPGITNEYEGLYTGRGYEGDYEFAIIGLSGDASSFMLKGKKRSTYVRMTRLPNDTDFKTYLADIKEFNEKVFYDAPSYPLIALGDTTFEFTKADYGIAELYPVGGDPITQNSQHAYLVTKIDGQYHLRFSQKVNRGNGDAQEFVYNAEEDQFHEINNSAYTISPSHPSPIDFFKEQFLNDKWIVVTRYTDTDTSEKMKQYIKAANDAMYAKNKKYRINEVQISRKTDEQAIWGFKYQSTSGAKSMDYLYNISFEGDVVTFTYDKADSTPAENILNTVPEVKTLMSEVLSRKFVVTKVNTKLNYKQIRFTAQDDADLWFILNY